jgi:hypothetical protein
MKYLRAQITRVQTRSLSCIISKHELTEEDLRDSVKDGEHEFGGWLHEPIKATFKLRNPSLYDYSLSLLDEQIILGIQSGEIVTIEKVTKANRCDFCSKLKLKHKFTELATCSGDELPRYYHTRDQDEHNKTLLDVSKEFEGYQKKTDDKIKDEYLYRDRNHNTDRWSTSLYSRFWDNNDQKPLKTRWRYSYKCTIHPICIDCVKNKYGDDRPRSTILELMRFLGHEFQEKHKIYNIDRILIKQGK